MIKSITKSDIEYYLNKNKSLTFLYKMYGFRYLGASKTSAKMLKSLKKGVETYCIYLAPSNMSGYNVCPNSRHCKEYCLFNSGHNKIEQLSNITTITDVRIKKTKLFYENRDMFMKIMIAEIIKTRQHAKDNNLEFAIRLNGTSDISPEEFIYEDKNILEIFPDIQFYDYTKVPYRTNLMNKYKNYDVTLSYNGHNWKDCEKFLNKGGKVAIVFHDNIPTEYKGFPVINGDGYDMRYLDNKGTIIGLTYHKTSKDYQDHIYRQPDTPFIV